MAEEAKLCDRLGREGKLRFAIWVVCSLNCSITDTSKVDAKIQ